MTEYFNETMLFIDRMGKWEWMAVVSVLLVVGFFCMRGFGSRGAY